MLFLCVKVELSNYLRIALFWLSQAEIDLFHKTILTTLIRHSIAYKPILFRDLNAKRTIQ